MEQTQETRAIGERDDADMLAGRKVKACAIGAVSTVIVAHK